MMHIKFSKTGQEKIIEFKFNKDDNSGARYGMIALGRSEDNKLVDCKYVMFKIDFKLAPKEWVIKNKRSALFGLCSWTTRKVVKEESSIGTETIKNLQNFFRLKALEEFQREGLINSINYFQSLEDATDSIENPSEMNGK